MEQLVLQMQLPAEPVAVSRARHEIIKVAGEVGCVRIDELALVVSELVANAVEHGRGPVTLRATRKEDRIRVDVHDRSTACPRVEAGDLDAERGRGMRIVSTLADDWGVVRHDIGKSVWVELPC